MLITIDAGNSRIKLAKWERDAIMHRGFCTYDRRSPSLDHLFAEAGDLAADTRVVVSNVSTQAVADAISAYCAGRGMAAPEFLVTTAACCGVTHSYEDPARHGVDRWATCIAAFDLYDEAVCVVDAGTAITFDIVDAAGRHRGGIIAPGYDTMYNAMLNRLAFVTDVDPMEVDENDSTGAMRKGCVAWWLGGSDRVLKQMKDTFGAELLTVFTGGQGEDMLNALGDAHRSELQPDLVMHGLKVYAEQAL